MTLKTILKYCETITVTSSRGKTKTKEITLK